MGRDATHRIRLPKAPSSLASENNLFLSSREPSSTSLGSGYITLTWRGFCGNGKSPVLPQPHILHAHAKPVHLFLEVNNSTKLLNTRVRKETFSDVSMLANRCKEKQAAFSLLCSCHRIVSLDNVSDVSACVILGKHSRKKKGLSQNPHARLFYTFPSWAGHTSSQEIKAVAQEAAVFTVT